MAASATRPRFSPLVYGCMRLNEWCLDAPRRLDKIKAILDLGIDSFDHADIYGGYGNEELFGQALALEPGLRERMKLVTKCGIQLVTGRRPETRVKHYRTDKAYIIESAEASLRKLGTDRIDLLLIHRPDALLEPAEVGEAFRILHDTGKVLAFGVSNFSPSQYMTLAGFCALPLVANQVEISPLHLDALYDGTLDQCLLRNSVPMAWSPFAGGRLFSATDPQAARVLAALGDLAQKFGITNESVVLAWLARLPGGVLPIVGTGDLARLATMTVDLPHLEPQDWYSIVEASLGHPVA